MLAGSLSTALFVASALPMLVKAARTRDLASYSVANLGLANLGNVLYAIYVFSLPGRADLGLAQLLYDQQPGDVDHVGAIFRHVVKQGGRPPEPPPRTQEHTGARDNQARGTTP